MKRLKTSRDEGGGGGREDGENSRERRKRGEIK